jgi:hypothetical protein
MKHRAVSKLIKSWPKSPVGNENKGKRQQFSRKASKYSIRQSGKVFIDDVTCDVGDA